MAGVRKVVAELGGVMHDATRVGVRRADDGDAHAVTLPASER